MRSGCSREIDANFQLLYDSVLVGRSIKKINESGIYPNLSQIADSIPDFERGRTFAALDTLEQLGLVKSRIVENNGCSFHFFYLSESGKYMLSEANDGEVF